MTDYSYISTHNRSAITRAHKLSKQLHFQDIPPIIMMIGLAEECREAIADIVQRMGTDMTSFCTALAAAVPFGSCSGSVCSFIPISDELDSLLSAAVSEALAAGKTEAGIMDVFKQLATSPGETRNVLFNLGCTQERILQAFHSQDMSIPLQQDKDNAPAHLKKYAIDLTELASKGTLSPVIGREHEIQRTMQILLRKTKNNPVLVGPAGCGKTAIAEGLAQLLADGEVPVALRNCRLYSLDICSLVAGAGIQGEFEDRLKQLMKDLEEHPEIILFIDEVHLLMGAGTGGSNMDAANILKSALSRGAVRIFGATTTTEYTKFIEADKAFERRFQKISVEEPDEQASFQILKGIKSSFEEFHGVNIPDDTIKAAIYLSKRYLTERCLPDKAIDLLDETASKLKISQFGKEEGSLEIVLKEEDIRNVVTLWTGIPLDHLQEEQEKFRFIEDLLSQKIIGQDEAVKAVSRVIRRNKMGFGDPDRPIGSFLFLGTTGVGKTALAKAIAEFLFGSEDMMVRIDMSEYQQDHTVSRLFGAPPGYVGYDQGGQLTESVRQHPYSVILLDEIEKAHTKVFETLLQVLDDGRMTDGQGRTVNFRNTIIIMTSNLEESQLQFRMSPEFLNRIDDIIRFNSLDLEMAMRICRIQMDIQVERMASMGISLSYDEDVVHLLCEKGYSAEYGVRAI